jgi:hypothetical protein
MKKSILNIGKILTKTEQKQATGGLGTNICYGTLPPLQGCGTCVEYHALPTECQYQVLVSPECFSN